MNNCEIVVVTSQRGGGRGGIATHLSLLLQELENDSRPYSYINRLSIIQELKFRSTSMAASLLARDMKQSVAILARVNALRSRFRTFLNRTRCYIVHCHDRYTLAAATLLKAEGYDLSLLLTAHAPFVENNYISNDSKLTMPLLQGFEMFSLNAADYIIAVDNIQADIVMQNAHEKPVSVIPNAVDLKSLKKINKFKSSGTKPFIIIARRLTSKNGIDVAIRAFAQSNACLKYQLRIVGDGHEEKALKVLVDVLNLANKVQFMGYQPREQTLRLIKGAIVSLIPSIPIGKYVEATSLTMLESMALGTPLIASNVGGLRQVLQGQEAALLVEPGNVGSLAKSIDVLVCDKALCGRLSARAKELVKRYDVSAWYASISKIYDCLENGCNTK